LVDPPRRPRRRRLVAAAVPRIAVPGATPRLPLPLRPPPAPDDPIDATRLSLRLAALAAALDDLPAQARRFVRWRARPVAPARGRAPDAARLRRLWPLRPGLPPGQSLASHRRPTHAVHVILDAVHGLAFEALAAPDTS
ncbi:hypothetical protein N1F89_14645, partial [Aquibium sp. A9E412]|nr:hypothetical protein [Aquibium sp. A9E412]